MIDRNYLINTVTAMSFDGKFNIYVILQLNMTSKTSSKKLKFCLSVFI